MESLFKYNERRADHYFSERLQLESAARLLEWKLSVGADPALELADLRAVLASLELYSDREKREAEAAKPKPLRMLFAACLGPAFANRMEAVS